MTRKVLITGASGFIGYHLISAATGTGMNMHASEAGTKISQLQHFNLRNVIPDYTDQDSYAPGNISRRFPGVHMFRIHVPAIVTFIKPKLARNINWYTNNKRF
jgi:dTDP-D-glucose 4,6-dehydratase